MKDTTRAWLVATAILLGSAECSDSHAVTPQATFENGQWQWTNPPPQPRQTDADFYSQQNYFMLLQQQQREYEARRQYEQDRRNAAAERQMELMMEGFR